MWNRIAVMAVAAVAVVTLWAGLYVVRTQAGQKEVEVVLVERMQDLNLTDEQEAKIADIRKEFRPKVQEAGKELSALLKEESEKCQSVLTAEQKSKLESAKEERQERRCHGLAAKIAHLDEMDLTEAEITKIRDIRKENQGKIEDALKQLQGVLSDDQKRAREEALKSDVKRKEMLQSLKLTDQQKEKFQAVGKEVAAIVKDELEKICEILTAEQKEKLEEFAQERKERVHDRMAHRIANLKELNLTDDQRTRITDIRKEYRTKVREAGSKLRDAIKEEAQAIAAVIKG